MAVVLARSIKNFYDQYVTREDRVFLGFVCVTVLFGFIYILINTLFTHYPGNQYLPSRWINLSPLILALTLLALYAAKQSPRSAFCMKSLGTYFFIMSSVAILSTGVQYTPFHVIDPVLVKLDQSMGFSTLGVLNWTYAHPHVLKTFRFCYNSIGLELLLIPVGQAILQAKKPLHTYFLASIIAYLIGFTIYYFWPTMGPSYMFSSLHFQAMQHDTALKFIQLHAHVPPTTINGGMIAFPSFHVIWSILLVYLVRDKKWLFYPLMVFNLLVLSSTVFLGWHYLTDVLGGVLLSALSIYLAEVIYKRYFVAHTVTATATDAHQQPAQNDCHPMRNLCPSSQA